MDSLPRRYSYKPGWDVGARLDRVSGHLVVVVRFDSYDADTGKPLSAHHTFEYVKSDMGWSYCLEDPWEDTICPDILVDVDGCVYDSVVRFEIHEIKHFLKRSGKHLVHPHAEL